MKASIPALKPTVRRFHGAKIPLYWFPLPWLSSACADRFGYMSSPATRAATKLPFNVATQNLLDKLGNLMGDLGRDPNMQSNNPADADVSNIPAGFTYFGQFVDHDITLDVSSTLDAETDANKINNMRSPSLDLDSVYGRGPGLDPFLYAFPGPGLPDTAIKLQVGTNRNSGAGGPSSNGTPGGMVTQTNWDVPRIPGTQTAVIGDPRNDENLIIVQFQHAMLRFHNAVVDMLLAANFAGDIFAEAKRMVTHHYQWAVVNDFLKRVCGAAAPAEVALLNANGALLLRRTPLWYYVLREAAVLGGGNQLGPVGGRIVAETFVRILKRDAGSYLNAAGGFAPILPSAAPGNFTVADLVIFAGVTQP